MEENRLIDFNNCPISDRNGIYGGNAGEKKTLSLIMSIG